MILSLLCPSSSQQPRNKINQILHPDSHFWWIYSPIIGLIPSWTHSLGPHGVPWRRCWINTISGYLCRFCKPETKSARGWNPDCASSAPVPLAVPFHLQFGISVGEELHPPLIFVPLSVRNWWHWEGKMELVSVPDFNKGTLLSQGDVCKIKIKKKLKKEKEMFVFPENYSCIYKIPPQKQNYAKKIAEWLREPTSPSFHWKYCRDLASS